MKILTQKLIKLIDKNDKFVWRIMLALYASMLIVLIIIITQIYHR